MDCDFRGKFLVICFICFQLIKSLGQSVGDGEDVRVAPCLRASKQVRIWSNELATAAIEDFKLVIERGVKLDAVFDDQSLAPDCAERGTCAQPELLGVLGSSGDSNHWNLCPTPHKLRRNFFNAYRNSSQMRAVDAFYTSVPAANAELLMPFNRSQIVVVAQPLDQGRESHHAFWLWVNNLVQLIRCSRNIVVANSVYHQQFVKYYTGYEVPLVAYYAGHVTHTYAPSGNQVYVHFDPAAPVGSQGAAEIAAEIEAKLRAATSFQPVKAPLAGGVSDWSGLASFRAVVLVPSGPSELFYTSLYRLNVPLFVPSKRLLAHWEQTKYVTRSRINWRHLPDMAAPKLPHHPYNVDDAAAVEYWLGLADFYQWPHVHTFESLDELAALLSNAQLDAVSQVCTPPTRHPGHRRLQPANPPLPMPSAVIACRSTSLPSSIPALRTELSRELGAHSWAAMEDGR
eukprot:TRINITY_DN9660_c3_g1_i1.p2 TRINITY_DN9660_c3_g1~~TRINITY_DN9660_c3_g1_i1.p2  ORF type:complete len:457 (-),score=149.65 TRINITY_DN9660_c3_g1_i1:546-1916(-)